ncbi:unnamed protein product, partial [Sphacelaria rigidula]
DGNEIAWPPGEQYAWLTTHMKVALFVFTHLLAGCDFLPRVSGIPFLKMWDFVLKAVRSPNHFTKPIVVIGDPTSLSEHTPVLQPATQSADGVPIFHSQ